MFKVGDIVKGKENSSERYGITNQDMYKGRIIKIRDDGDIDIKILKHKNKNQIGKTYSWLEPKYFMLVEYTYEDLKKSPIGTKITFENGNILMKTKKDGNQFTDNGSKNRAIEDLKKLRDNWAGGAYGKIIKIEEPEYKPVYDTEILDNTEKRYLKNIIRPFRDKVEYITKTVNVTGELEHINIILKRDTGLVFPNFEKGTMYRGMEIGKQYTLSGLGI